ncbi:MAG: sigma-70 family RNA polymerase sigma factor [Candidatus Nanoarchaeia archaeon]|nr:sigma-70 family RNA polymerase sigma factor [Candidatus Nanoarchaeia archaeon]
MVRKIRRGVSHKVNRLDQELSRFDFVEYQSPEPSFVNPLWSSYKSKQGQAGAERSRNQLIEIYFPYVQLQAVIMSRRLPDWAPDTNELASHGVWGLMDAIDAFDLSLRTKFEGYATLRIRGAMLDVLRKVDRIQRHERGQASLYDDTRYELMRRNVGPVSSWEVETKLIETYGPDVAERIISAKAYSEAFLDSDRTIPIFETKNENGYERRPRTFTQNLRDESTESPLNAAERQEILEIALGGLDERERTIIMLHYYEGKSMEEVGRCLQPRIKCKTTANGPGLSQACVSGLHKGIIRKLQGDERLREYFETGID